MNDYVNLKVNVQKLKSRENNIIKQDKRNFWISVPSDAILNPL